VVSVVVEMETILITQMGLMELPTQEAVAVVLAQ
jgi:hypothetical protein